MWYIVCVIYWFLQQFRRRRELKKCQVLNNREKTVGILSPYFRSRRGFYFTHKILNLVINKLKLYTAWKININLWLHWQSMVSWLSTASMMLEVEGFRRRMHPSGWLILFYFIIILLYFSPNYSWNELQ